MLEIQSMTHATLYMTVTVFFILLFTLRANPLTSAYRFAHSLLTSRKYLFHFLALLAILFFNKIELAIENNMAGKWDFTPDFYNLEGDLVAWIQQTFMNDGLTAFLTYYYVVVFTSLLIASIGIYTYTRQYQLFYALCYAVMINYMIAIPFYFFFPINEVWYFHPKVDFLIPQYFPTFEQEYRPLSGLNNCFPSLHTSLSVTIALIAAKSDNRVWRWFTAISACIIIFSIFYLGIHWVIDMAGGFLLALSASRIGLLISEGRRVVIGEKLRVDSRKWSDRNAQI